VPAGPQACTVVRAARLPASSLHQGLTFGGVPLAPPEAAPAAIRAAAGSMPCGAMADPALADPALSCVKCGATFKYKKNVTKHMMREQCGKKRGRSAAGFTQRKFRQTATNGVRDELVPLSRFRVRASTF
jgi:hypothetical protein